MTKFQAQMAGSAGDFRSRVVRPGVMLRASSVMRLLLCSLVRAYQLLLSPLLPRTCRFTPSCSEYMIQAITVYGVRRGVGKGLWRLLRCQPFAKGGYDPVIPKREVRLQITDYRMQNCPSGKD